MGIYDVVIILVTMALISVFVGTAISIFVAIKDRKKQREDL